MEQLQKAIEQTIDEDTAALPLLPDLNLVEPSPQSPTSSDLQKKPGIQQEQAQIHHWFFTFMCMNIPIVGWIYLLYLAFSKKKADRRMFARAYLYYKLIFLLLSAAILGVLIYFGMEFLDQLLAYMELL